MHILERYSLSTGLRIEKPFIAETFIELPKEPFFTIHCDSEAKSKTYWHWRIVINEVYKECEKKGIKILQVGVGETKFKNTIDYVNKTTFNQLAFILRHSLFHVGIDSCPAHIADFYNKDCLILFSTYIENCRPTFGAGRMILLAPSFDVIKPSFSTNDSRINEISPTLIINGIKEFLSAI